MSDNLVSQNEDTEEILKRRLREILGRQDLPAFSQHIQQILRCAGEENTSIRQVTSIVLREYGISLKLLRTANSPIYNRSGRPILSVSHAASLMGLQAIRDLAAGTLLFEHFRNRSPGLRELMVLSLLTANHARETASLFSYPRIEEAYLCGMFRNLGEVLTACYFPLEYAQILTVRKQLHLSDRHACRRVMQFTYEDLGRTMVEHWGLPDAVRECQREFAPGTTRLMPSHRDLLSAIVSYSHQLTDIVYRGDPATIASRVRAQRDSFRLSLGISQQQMERVLSGAIEETRETSRTLNIPLDALRLQRQMEAAILIAPADGGSKPRDEVSGLSERIESGDFELNDILLAILESVSQAGSLDHVLFGLVDPASNTILGRVGIGEGIDPLLNRFRFQLSMRGGPIALAILRKHDLFLFGDHDARFDRSAFTQSLGSRNFLLCPVIVDGVVIGCLYGDRIAAAPLPKENESRVAGLRDLAAEAIKKKRSQTLVTSSSNVMQ